MLKRPPVDDILFSELTNIPSIDKALAVEGIESIPDEFWYWDQYRTGRMVTIMSKGGLGGRAGAALHRPGEFDWTPYCPRVISEWFDNYIFNWMSQRTRITVIWTEPGATLLDHIDSAEAEYGTLQHKLRYVLRGTTDSLYFNTDQGKVFAPAVDGPFLIDGSWYHGMTNTCAKPKVTLALGGPWVGETQYPSINHLLKRSDYNPQENFRDFFDSTLKLKK
jgi:hypothetical protein